jgi:hypothetical protein
LAHVHYPTEVAPASISSILMIKEILKTPVVLTLV